MVGSEGTRLPEGEIRITRLLDMGLAHVGLRTDRLELRLSCLVDLDAAAGI